MIHNLLKNPSKVFVGCICFALASLLLSGNLLTIWSLHRDRDRLNEQILTVGKQIVDLDIQLKKSKDPVFIQQQAADRFDLVGENDLVFVFSDEQ